MTKQLLVLLLHRLEQSISQHYNTKMDQQSFTRKKTVIGRDALWGIPRKHLAGVGSDIH